MKNLVLLWVVSVSLASAARAQGLVHEFYQLEDACVGLGDLDGDGHPELALTHAGTGAEAGRVSIRSSRTGDELYMLVGALPGSGFGLALARLGDLDGDGHDDLAVSMPLAAAPLVYLVSARTGTLLGSLSPTVPGEFGRVLASGGDVDGDGVADLLVGSPTPNTGGPGGYVEVLSMATGSSVRTHAALDVTALAFLGDVDGDGRDDYAIGIPGSTLGGPTQGSVEVHSGASGASLYTLVGSFVHESFGKDVAGVGDVDGDGAGDLLIGSPGVQVQSFNTGAAFLHSGATGAQLRGIRPPWPNIIQYGEDVSGIGDYDGDGTPDLVVMHSSAWVGGVIKNFGAAYVYSGATGGLLEKLDLHGLHGPLVDVGDANLDGTDDLCVADAGTASGLYSILLLGAAPAVAPFCTGKPTSGGCVPAIDWSGSPSLSIGNELSVRASALPPSSPAILLWSLSGLAFPYGYGPLCIAPPFVPALAASSGGGPLACSGSLEFTFARSYLTAQGLGAGTQVFVQAWVRDGAQPSSRPVAMTRGLQFTVWP